MESRLGGMDLYADDQNGRGWKDFLGGSAPTITEAVTPFLIDGRLSVQALLQLPVHL